MANGAVLYTPLSRGSNGDLNLAPDAPVFYDTPETSHPTPKPGSDSFYAWPQFGESPDPTDHFAVIVEDVSGCLSIPEAIAGTNEAGCSSGNSYLASYTMNSEGNLSTTNTWENMPLVQAQDCCSDNMLLNPAGTILAVSGGPGVQFFKFNGANPMTPLGGTPIVSTYGSLVTMQWDKDSHLYALNSQSGRLHVWSVTDKGAVEVSGSPYTVPFCGLSRTAD